MRSHREEFWFNVPTRRAFVKITAQVEQALHESEGPCLVNANNLPSTGHNQWV